MSRFRVSKSRLLRSLLVVSFLLIALLAVGPTAAAQDTWDGTNTSSMKNGNNWSPTSTPASGDDLIFPATPTRLTPDVDFTTRRTFNTFTFADGAYSMTG